MRKITCLSALLLAACLPQTPTRSPLDLLAERQIDPACFAGAFLGVESPDDSNIPVDNCHPELTRIDSRIDEDGSHSVRLADPDVEGIENLLQYKPLGYLQNGRLAVSFLSNTGGTGYFSSLSEVETAQDGHSLRIAKTYLLGDRCMGGLAEASVIDGQLHYATHITRYDILGLGRDENPWDFGIVDGSAAGCVALAVFQSNSFTGIQLPDDFADRLSDYRVSEQDNPGQYCYDDLLLLNFQYGNRFFAAEDLPVFIREIEHTCLGAAEAEQ